MDGEKRILISARVPQSIVERIDAESYVSGRDKQDIVAEALDAHLPDHEAIRRAARRDRAKQPA